MQTTSVLVAIGGDQGNTVPKSDITVAELVVLAGAHGRDAVIELPNSRGEKRVKHAREYARLVTAYGQESVTRVFGPSSFGVQLPTRFSDLSGFDEEADDLDDDDEDYDDEPTPAPAAPVAPASAPKADTPASK